MLYSGRLLGFPPGIFKGGRRVFSLLQKRRVYNPNWRIKTIQTPDGPVDKYTQPPQIQPLNAPNSIYPRPQSFDYVRQPPTQQPPPGSITTYIKITVVVPGGQPFGVDGLHFQPGESVIPNMYVTPFEYIFVPKKLLIIPYDTDYDTLYVSMLKNGNQAFHLQGANRLAPDSAAEFSGGGWELLPNWPQDQFNNEIVFRANERVGVRLINDTPGEREVHIAVFGWKFRENYYYSQIGL